MNEIKKIFKFIKPYKKMALLSLALLLVMVAMDLSIPKLIERIIDQGVRQQNLKVVLQTSAIMLTFSVINASVAILNSIFSIRVGESVARDLRSAIFKKVQQFSYGNLDRFTTGKLIVRLTSDTAAVQRITQFSLRIGTRGPLLMIGSVILMFLTSRKLALAMLPLLLVMLVIVYIFSTKMEPLFRMVQQRLDRLNTLLQENIAGARLIKAFVRSDLENKRFAGANQELTSSTTRVMTFMSSMSPVLTFMINIGIALIIWRGGTQAIDGTLTIGEIVAFTNYLMTTMQPMLMLTQFSNTWANGIASAKRINEVLDSTPEIQIKPDAKTLPPTCQDRVVFQNVDFHYNGNSALSILEDICFTAEPGQTVAILGATGSGKSSLINLIPRFYDTSNGQVLIDGIDVRDLEEGSLLEHISIVPQETILFSGTIRDNIRYGKPEASQEEVMAAAKIAQAHDFILELPEGYDTHVEERGGNLSGGQKQRIAIARAIITYPQILILDDSTSAIDVETETRIQNGLAEVMRGRTSFIVAQRISTVLNAEKIIVLDQGHIAGEGTHAELLRSNQIYQEIYESQLGNGIHV